ncbi:NAD(P)/FAD-dependent oxidoreductase [Dactylosporangium sp. CA-233914]|uniref:NAD(P)/FAD-dependent oxidoreductase n=1 Tax=Dactylosporangium sp. CA-233914 TaxID=3239934 RepID=UPI003D948607
MSAALALRRGGFDGAIAIVDSDPREPYERPPLSKTLLSNHASLLKPIVDPATYREEGIDLLGGLGVCGLDSGAHRVLLDDGTALDADRVLLATGVAARDLNLVSGPRPNVLRLRTADDAGALATWLARGGPLVIVGGGFIGLELAAEARRAGIDTTVVEMAPLPLYGPAGPAIGQLVRELHEANGVRFHLSTTVAAMNSTHTSREVHEVVLNDGTRLPAAVVVVGVGVIPRDELARSAGVATDGGIVVDEYGRTENPWLWAAGDVASQPHPHLQTRGRIEHWDVALRHGEAVGLSMAGQLTALDAPPYFWSDQYDQTLQSFGRSRPGDTFVLRRDATPARFLGFWLRDSQVAAVMGLDCPREVRAGKQLIESGVTITANELADPDTDLRAISRRGALAKPRTEISQGISGQPADRHAGSPRST